MTSAPPGNRQRPQSGLRRRVHVLWPGDQEGPLAKVTFRHVLADIETLNRKAMEGQYDLSAISYHAYPYVADKYVLMASGSSIGDGYGPMIIATRPMEPEELKGKRIAIPGNADHGLSGLQAVPAGFRSRRHAVRQDHRRRARAHRGCRADHPRSAVDVRPRRLPPHRRSGPLVQELPTGCRCRWAATCCCGRSMPKSRASAAA